MAQVTTPIVNQAAWVDLSSSDAQASRDFYAKVFGWQVEVNPDPQYGGYALAKLGGEDVAGIGPAQTPDTPTAWSVYIGTPDIDALAKRVQAAGGNVVAPPFDVGDQGKMAVFQDPAGAFISAWQGDADGRLPDRCPEFVRLVRAECARCRRAPSRSTPRSSAGRRGRARWARVSRRIPNSCWTGRAWPAPGR